MDSTGTAKIRLYVDHLPGEGQSVPLTRAQAHYLFGVMRLGQGGLLKVFDGKNGEWLAEVSRADKRGGELCLMRKIRDTGIPPDVWLMFAPVKKARTDFIVEKAVETGARRILPVRSEFTNAGRIQRERLQAHAVEAAEQCGATYVPPVEAMENLNNLLADWDPERRIMFCDEAAAGETLRLPDTAGPWAILIGPEGGFSEAERKKLHALPFAHPVSLGPRILRADTAAVAAMTLWQTTLGDWR